MEISHEKKDGIDIFVLDGALDMSSAERVQEAVVDAIRQGAKIVLDIHSCSCISDAWPKLLIIIAKQSAHKGAESVLVGVEEGISDVIDLTGFSDLLHSFQTTEDAVAYLKGGASKER